MLLKVQLQVQDPETEQWSLYKTFHTCDENRTGGNEYTIAGSEFSSDMITLTFRYSPALAKVFSNTQLYRVVVLGATWDIKSYDDPQFKHEFIKLICRRIYG